MSRYPQANFNTEDWDAYWRRENKRVLWGASIGNYFVSNRYHGAEPILEKGLQITPDMVAPERFLKDNDRLFEESQQTAGDLVFSAMPFPGIPWLEATAGCGVQGGQCSFYAERVPDRYLQQPVCQRKPDWADMYFHSLDRMEQHSGGRYAVGQPIIRGPGDLLGAMFGSQELVLLMMEEEDLVHQRLDEATRLLIDFFKCQQRTVHRFHGGYTMGFYQMWCPEFGVYYQDDVLALLSPKLYREFLWPLHCKISSSFPYSLFHLHPNCLYAVDGLMDIPELSVLEINKDVSGPGVAEMLPLFKDILKRKCLHIWGDITEEEMELIQTELPPNGLCVTIFKE